MNTDIFYPPAEGNGNIFKPLKSAKKTAAPKGLENVAVAFRQRRKGQVKREK